jgi:hypothetical protein
MATFHGLGIYEILENGNLLNGVYTNTNSSKGAHIPHPYDIDNEIARKEEYNNKGVGGTYVAKYIETTPNPNKVTHCTLEITKQNEVYEFEWRDASGVFFTGIGMKVGNNHIAVSYSNP